MPICLQMVNGYAMILVIGTKLTNKKLRFLFPLLLELCSHPKTTLLVSTMIEYSDDRRDLQTERLIDNFIEDCEREAARLEITVDYYIAEFT